MMSENNESKPILKITVRTMNDKEKKFVIISQVGSKEFDDIEYSGENAVCYVSSMVEAFHDNPVKLTLSQEFLSTCSDPTRKEFLDIIGKFKANNL